MFLEQIAAIEAAGQAHKSWPATTKPFRYQLSQLIDTSGPTETWPFLVIRNLASALEETIEAQKIIAPFESLYKLSIPTIHRPLYKGLGGVEWKGEVIGWKGSAGNGVSKVSTNEKRSEAVR